RHCRVKRHDMRVGETRADSHLAEETLLGVWIVDGGGRQRPQILDALRQGVLDAILHRAAGSPDDVEKLVPGVSVPKFELHPTGLLAGSAPAAAWQSATARHHGGPSKRQIFLAGEPWQAALRLTPGHPAAAARLGTAPRSIRGYRESRNPTPPEARF